MTQNHKTPYNFLREELDSPLYMFVTSTNKIYAIGFDPTLYVKYLDDFPRLLTYGYGLTIVRNPKKLNRKEINKDDRIWPTIYEIGADFMKYSGPETVLLFHCDATDNKQASRDRLFEKRYGTLPEEHNLFKYSLEVEVELGDGLCQYNYLGFLCGEEFPYKEEAILEMDKFAVHLISINESK